MQQVLSNKLSFDQDIHYSKAFPFHKSIFQLQTFQLNWNFPLFPPTPHINILQRLVCFQITINKYSILTIKMWTAAEADITKDDRNINFAT